MSSSNQSYGGPGSGGATPTWDTIKTYFRQTDIDHMKNVSKGKIDLSNCASVAANAQDIYNMVCTDPNNPNCQGAMPPDQNWSDEWQQNFLAWMNAGAKCS
jgi:hypothetical protein